VIEYSSHGNSNPYSWYQDALIWIKEEFMFLIVITCGTFSYCGDPLHTSLC